MYISKQKIQNGYNEYIKLDSPEGRLSMMDVGLIILDKNEVYYINERDKECAILLLEGEANIEWNGQKACTERLNPFDYKAWCLHTPPGVNVKISAQAHSEFYIQKTYNNTKFKAKMYSPKETQTLRAGSNGELQGMMRRNIRTIFDYSSAPYSNMVLGEVINFPGRWSSYPPHWHPQPEVYFYRYDKPQGFGVGFTNGQIFETHHNGLLLITDKPHSQTAAPGYTLYYVWGIRHLPCNPWKKTRIDDPQHTWMLEERPHIWTEKEEL